MRRILPIILILAIAGAAGADNITDFKSPGIVRDDVSMPAYSEWIIADVSASACPSADCCPDTSLDSTCVAAGDPLSCCTGPAAGTCNHEACESFQKALAENPSRWLPQIEIQYQNEATAFACNSWLEGSQILTACTTVPATPLIRFADIASRVAARDFPPQ